MKDNKLDPLIEEESDKIMKNYWGNMLIYKTYTRIEIFNILEKLLNEDKEKQILNKIKNHFDFIEGK